MIADDCTRRFRPVQRAYFQLVKLRRITNFRKQWMDQGGKAGLKGWCIGRVNTSFTDLWYYDVNITAHSAEAAAMAELSGSVHGQGPQYTRG